MRWRGRAGLSDGQSEGADDAVHGLVLPAHGAAPCRGRSQAALKTRRAGPSKFSGSGQTLGTQLCSQQRRSAVSSIKRFER